MRPLIFFFLINIAISPLFGEQKASNNSYWEKTKNICSKHPATIIAGVSLGLAVYLGVKTKKAHERIAYLELQNPAFSGFKNKVYDFVNQQNAIPTTSPFYYKVNLEKLYKHFFNTEVSSELIALTYTKGDCLFGSLLLSGVGLFSGILSYEQELYPREYDENI
jgi:hypothetical protein